MNIIRRTNYSKDKLLTYLFCTILTIFLVLRDIFAVSINKYLYLVVVIVFMGIASYEVAMDMMSFILPLLCGLPSNYIFIFFLLKMIWSKKINKKITVIYLFYILLWEVSGILLYTQLLDNELLKQVVFTWIFFSILFCEGKMDYYNKLKMYLLGTVLVCLVIIIYSISRAPSNWLYLFSQGWYRFGDVALDGIDGMTLRLNSNSLAYFSIIGIMVAIVLIRSRKGLINIIYSIFAFILIIAGFLSVSRSWILVAVFCSFIWILSEMKGIKGLIITILSFLIGGFLISRIIAEYPELLDGILARLMDKSAAGGNGRTELMSEYGKRIIDNVGLLLFGSGAAHYRQAYKMDTSIHNGSMQILLSYGVIGGGIFIIGMVYPLYRLIHNSTKKIKLFYWLPLFSIIMFAQTIQFVNPAYLMMPYIIGVYAIRLGMEREEK